MGSNALGDLTVQAVTHYGYDTGYSGGTQLSLPKLFPQSCVFAVAVGGDLNAFICDFVSFPLGPGGLYCSLVI